MEEFARLRAWVTRVVTGAVLTLVMLDGLDDVLLGNRWPGPPRELIAVLGTLVGGLYAPEVLRALRRNGRNGRPRGGVGDGA